MASILGAVIFKSMAGKIGDVIASSLATKAKASSPVPGPPASAVTQAVVEAIGKSEEIAVVPVQPGKKSSINLGAIFGAAFTLLTFYGGDIVPAPVADALDTIGQAIGLPPKLVPSLVIVGTFIFVFVRKQWFDHSITSKAADRAYDKGKVV